MLKKWHDQIKDVIYKANELTDKIDSKALRRKMEGDQSVTRITEKVKGFNSTPLFDSDVKHELEEILPTLKNLLDLKDALGLKGVKPRLCVRFRSPPVAEESGVFGRETIFKKIIIDSLRFADVSGEKIPVIPIIGAGGLGKTALAQIIYNNPKVK